MRTTLTVSMIALAVAGFSTTSEAQIRGGNGQQASSQGSNSGFSQQGGSRFQNRSVQAPVSGNRTFQGVRPPTPGNTIGGGNVANRSFQGVRPPTPGNTIGGGNVANRSFQR